MKSVLKGTDHGSQYNHEYFGPFSLYCFGEKLGLNESKRAKTFWPAETNSFL